MCVWAAWAMAVGFLMEGESSIAILSLFLLALASSSYCFFYLSTVAIHRSRGRHLARAHIGSKPGIKVARRIIFKPERYVLLAQIGTLLSGLSIGALLLDIQDAPSIRNFLLWFEAQYYIPHLFVVFLCIIFYAVLLLIFTQFVAAFVKAHPEIVLCYLSYVLFGLEILFRPLLGSMAFVLRPMLSMFGLSLTADRVVAITVEEIGEIVTKSSEAGKIEEDESDLLKGVIHFSDLHVAAVMTPRTDVVTINYEAPLKEAVEMFTEEGLSRLVLIGDELDDVKGILLAKDLIPLIASPVSDIRIKDLMREAFTTTGTKQIDDLFEEFRKSQNHFAVVLDEHGGVDGVVTMEDLLEEIVGEIFDEFDDPEEETQLRETKSGDVIVDGSTIIEELNEIYGYGLPEGEYDTIAGFVINELGRIPEVHEYLDYNGIRIQIEGVFQNRVTDLRVIKINEHDDLGGEYAIENKRIANDPKS